MLSERSRADRILATFLGYVLRGGVLAAACLVVCGGWIYLANHGSALTDYRAFQSEPADFRSIHGIIAEARAGSGRGLIQLGLLVLIGTPILRVVCSVAGFALERDWVYVTITLVVLALLVYGLVAL